MQNKSTIGFLNKQYKNVLIKCFMAGLLAISFTDNANAVDVATYVDLNTYASDNVTTDINITNNINLSSVITITADKIINADSFTFDGGKNSQGFNTTAGTHSFNNVIFNNFNNTSNYGAAIYNQATINNISGEFADNKASYGAAIANHSGTIINIIGDFSNNVAINWGGAIYNKGDEGPTLINNLTGTFTNNSSSYGGAIYNNAGTITNLGGTFTKNKAFEGGAIDNDGTITNITNTIFTENEARDGGAIYNANTIANITTSTFANNYALSTNANTYGGAIYNNGTITNITNNIFTNNYAQSSSNNAFGGAIYNNGTITLTNNIFINNYTQSSSAFSLGGAIYNNTGATTNIIANNGLALFNGNKSNSISNAIHNKNIINLNAGYNTTSPQNGAGLIHIKDHVTGGEPVISWIFSSPFGTININSPITGVPSNGWVMFDNNIWSNHIAINSGSLSFANGTTSTIGTSLTGATNFTATAGSNLYIDLDLNNNKNDFLTFNFSGQINIAFRMLSDLTANSQRVIWSFASTVFSPTYSDAYTNNALYRYNSGNIDKSTTYIDATTAFNTAINDTGLRTFSLTSGLDLSANGGIMADTGTLTIFGKITNLDVMNYNANTFVWELNPSFDANRYDAINGNNQYQVIDVNNANATLNIMDSVIKNAQAGGKGGAIHITNGTANIYNSYFDSNHSENSPLDNGNGGAIHIAGGTANIFNTAFTNNTASQNGGAIENNSITNIYNSHFANNNAAGGGAFLNRGTANIYNSSFINNSSNLGGAIANTGTSGILNIYAINGTTKFSGNKEGSTSNAINNIGGTINLLANNGTIIFDDSITSTRLGSHGTINIGDATHDGIVELNADMSGFEGNTILANGTIKIGAGMGKNHNTNFFGGTFTSTGGTLDSQNGIMDLFDTNSWTTANPLNAKIDVDFATGEGDYFEGNGKDINITGINVINPQTVTGKQVQIANNNNSLTLDNSAKTISTNIYRYTVDDTNLQTQGTLSFDGSLKASGFSAIALASSGARSAHLNNAVDISNKVLDPHRLEVAAQNLPSGDAPTPFVSAWTDFSGSKEDVKLDNITVDNESYTGLVGADIKGKDYNGFNTLYSVYTGYTNSEQNYENVTTKQNAFIAGGAMTLSKAKTTSATTANIGISFVDEQSASGKSDFNMYSLSLANKTSYKQNLGCTRFSLIPSITGGYHYIYTEDYTNANGTQINSDGLHILNIKPELKLSADYNKYQPYASIGFNLNIDTGGDVTADNAAIPLLTVDNYAEFAIGTTAQIKDNISGFTEIKATTSDRQGYGGQVGVKWDF